jgi:hypothetical protein
MNDYHTILSDLDNLGPIIKPGESINWNLVVKWLTIVVDYDAMNKLELMNPRFRLF